MGKLIECYDLDGNMGLKYGVDAKECVDKLGWSMKPPGAEAANADKKVKESMQSATVEDFKKSPIEAKNKKGR